MKKIYRQNGGRSGVMLFAVLICIGIALLLTMAALQTSLHQRRHLSRTLQLEQTRLLLDAAADSPALKEWFTDLEDDEDNKPLKIELELPTGKPAAVTASVEPNKQDYLLTYLLTAMIGDVDNQVFVTRRSKSASLKRGDKDD